MCLHQVTSRTTDIPTGKPLADPPRTALTSPNMVHIQHDQLAVYFVADSPPPPPPLFSPFLFKPLCNHDYKGELIYFIHTKSTPWGLSAGFPPHIRDSRSLSLSPRKVSTFHPEPSFSPISPTAAPNTKHNA